MRGGGVWGRRSWNAGEDRRWGGEVVGVRIARGRGLVGWCVGCEGRWFGGVQLDG